MHLTNVRETVLFPAISLYCQAIENQGFVTKLNTYFSTKMTTPNMDLSELEQELKEICPEEVKTSLKDNGVEEPYASLGLSTSLGQVIFDIYIKAAEVPVSPLKKKALEKRILDLAQSLDKDEFDIPEDVEAVLKKVLNDDELWMKQSFSVEIGTDKQFFLTYAGIENFKKVILSLVEAFSEN